MNRRTAYTHQKTVSLGLGAKEWLGDETTNVDGNNYT